MAGVMYIEDVLSYSIIIIISVGRSGSFPLNNMPCFTVTPRFISVLLYCSRCK